MRLCQAPTDQAEWMYMGHNSDSPSFHLLSLINWPPFVESIPAAWNLSDILIAKCVITFFVVDLQFTGQEDKFSLF